MNSALFAYGTLMFPAVWRAVVGRAQKGVPATLNGFACQGLRGEVFPGLVGRVGGQVAGIVYDNISEADWRILDEFEADFYERWTVQVDTAVGTIAAEAYVVSPQERGRLSGQAWDARQFEREHLAKFLRKLSW